MRAITLPFQIVNGSVGATSSARRIVEQQILDVLVTSKYERVMIPQYGAGTNNLLYEIADDNVLAEFKTEAMLDLQEHVDGAGIVDMRFKFGSASGEGSYNTSLEVTVLYSIPPGTVNYFSFTVSE